jgi:hypothetical protein
MSDIPYKLLSYDSNRLRVGGPSRCRLLENKIETGCLVLRSTMVREDVHAAEPNRASAARCRAVRTPSHRITLPCNPGPPTRTPPRVNKSLVPDPESSLHSGPLAYPQLACYLVEFLSPPADDLSFHKRHQRSHCDRFSRHIASRHGRSSANASPPFIERSWNRMAPLAPPSASNRRLRRRPTVL